jgi:hypothetical protein
VTVNRSGTSWTGSEAGDIDEYLAHFTAAQYPVSRIEHARCASCSHDVFRIRLDDEEGCAERICTGCGTTHLLLDSEDTVEDAELEEAACPCGGETFNAAVGFALRDDGDVRWVHLGLRCTTDGTLGVYTDWKVDYSPTAHLFESA